MITFTYRDKEDRENLVLGITPHNVTRMKEGSPLYVNVAELGLSVNGSIAVFYADTEQALYDAVKELIGPDTKTHFDPRVDIKR